MNIREMHFDIRQKVDKLASFSSDNLNPGQIDWYINYASDLEVDSRLGINNINRQGIETTQKRIDDLKQIHIKCPTSIQPAVVPTLAGDLPYGEFYELKLNNLMFPYLQLTGLRCKISKSGCSDKVIGLTETNENELDFILIDPNYKPDYKWGVCYFTIDASTDNGTLGSIYLYTAGEFSITEVYPTYYKRPKKVFFGGYNSLDGVYLAGDPAVNSELERIHNQICQRAVELIMTEIQDPELAQLAELKQNKYEF